MVWLSLQTGMINKGNQSHPCFTGQYQTTLKTLISCMIFGSSVLNNRLCYYATS